MSVYQYGGACFSTAVDAAGAMVADQVGQGFTSGSNVYVKSVGTITAGASADRANVAWRLDRIQGTGTTPINATAVAHQFPACELPTYQDGLALGWGVAAAWFAAYGLKHLARAVWR